MFLDLPEDDGKIVKSIAIKTIFADQIRDRTKTFELRTYSPGVKQNGWCAIYEPRPAALIQSVMQIGNTFKLSPDEAWEKYSDYFGIDFDSYFLYFRKREFAFGMEIKQVRSFTPIPLHELREDPNFRIPQMCMTMKSMHKRIHYGIHWAWTSLLASLISICYNALCRHH